MKQKRDSLRWPVPMLSTIRYLFISLFVLVTLASCIIFPIPDLNNERVNDVSQVKVSSTSKAEVVKILGLPDAQDKDKNKFFYSAYDYSFGLCFVAPGAGGGCARSDREPWWITVYFDKKDIVWGLLIEEAKDHNLSVLYKELYLLKDQWITLCRDAITGDKTSQLEIASSYKDGRKLAPRDPVKAYLWFERATKNFESLEQYKVNEFSNFITEDELKFAKRISKDWKPTASSCRKDFWPPFPTSRLMREQLPWTTQGWTTPEDFNEICRLAMRGDAYSQIDMARGHWNGIKPLPHDRSAALMWLRNAKNNGSARADAYLEFLRPELSKDEIEAAEKLFNNWAPDPRKCEAPS